MKEYPFKATVFTSEPAFHDMPTPEGTRFVRFVLDLSTVQFPRNPCVVDFNHDSGEPVGRAKLRVDDAAITAEGALVSASDGDRAFQLGETLASVPFGISPTLELDVSKADFYREGEEFTVNGRKLTGECVVYRGARVLGVSICPLPTDNLTSVSPLKRDGVVTLSQTGIKALTMNEERKPIPVDEKTVEQLGDETGICDGVQTVRDPELQEFIDAFGLEKGVAFFQRGLTLDEAKMEDYEELKRLSRLAAEEEPKREDCAEPCEEAKQEEEGAAKLSLDLRRACSALNGLVAALNRVGVAKLGAQSSPRWRGVPEKKTYADSIREAIRR